jgi:selenide, water dikinase
MDCSIRRTRYDDLFVVSTTNFFFPLVDAPGRIRTANVLSDLFSTGVTSCDTMLMLLASCNTMSPNERITCTNEIVRGFRYTCVVEPGTNISGGQTVLNPWPIIGGVATAIVRSNECINNNVGTIGNKTDIPRT